MIAANNKVIVRVNLKQKDKITVSGVTVSTALKYELNYREKSPVVAEVIEGNDFLKAGDILLSHHNFYYPPSPFHLQDDLFAVPFGSSLFAIVGPDGELKPICGNIICSRVEIPSDFPLPPEHVKTYVDRSRVVDPGDTKYKVGQLIFHRKHAGYDIVYVWNTIEKRVTKVHESQICAFVK